MNNTLKNLIIRFILWLLKSLSQQPAHTLVHSEYGTIVVPIDGGIPMKDDKILMFFVTHDYTKENAR